MKFKYLRKASGMTQKEFAEYFNIPLRSIENWEADPKKCKPYLLDLMHYKLQKEGFVIVIDKELAKQAFKDLAEEMKKECGDWQNIPDTEADKKIRERIMAEVEKLEQNKKEGRK